MSKIFTLTSYLDNSILNSKPWRYVISPYSGSFRKSVITQTLSLSLPHIYTNTFKAALNEVKDADFVALLLNPC